MLWLVSQPPAKNRKATPLCVQFWQSLVTHLFTVSVNSYCTHPVLWTLHQGPRDAEERWFFPCHGQGIYPCIYLLVAAAPAFCHPAVPTASVSHMSSGSRGWQGRRRWVTAPHGCQPCSTKTPGPSGLETGMPPTRPLLAHPLLTGAPPIRAVQRPADASAKPLKASLQPHLPAGSPPRLPAVPLALGPRSPVFSQSYLPAQVW